MKCIRLLSVLTLFIVMIINVYGGNTFYNNRVITAALIACNKNKYGDYVVETSEISSVISKLKVSIIAKNDISGRIVIEGYSSLFRDYVVVNCNRVNIQISIMEDKCILGIPLIKNSF